jgi:hypothetical protein
MSPSTWLRNRTSQSVTSARSRRRPLAPRFRPQFEVLERRDVFTHMLLVTNTLDSGPGSLRYEIAAAGNGKDTIGFAPSLNGQTIMLTSGALFVSRQQNLTIQGPGAG